MARFEWTQISLDNFDHDFEALLTKLKACLDEADGVKEEVRDGKWDCKLLPGLTSHTLIVFVQGNTTY